MTARGIVLLYNAGNSGTYGDPRLPARVYTGGQALYDAVWHYNHADWYVQMVLGLAQKYAA